MAPKSATSSIQSMRSSLPSSLETSFDETPSRTSTPLTIPSLESSLCDFLETELRVFDTPALTEVQLNNYVSEDLRDGHAGFHGIQAPLSHASSSENLGSPKWLTAHPAPQLPAKPSVAAHAEEDDDNDEFFDAASVHSDSSEQSNDIFFDASSSYEAADSVHDDSIAPMPGAWVDAPPSVSDAASDVMGEPRPTPPSVTVLEDTRVFEQGNEKKPTSKTSDFGSETSTQNVSEGTIPAAAKTATAASVVEQVARLVAHKRKMSLESLQPGTHKLSGMGWERMLSAMKTVDVTVEPETRIHIEMALRDKAAQAQQNQGLIALCLGVVTGWASAGWRTLSGQKADAPQAASHFGVQSGIDVAAQHINIGFSRPIVARPEGWWTKLFRVELNGARLGADGRVTPQGRVKLLNFLSLGIGWTRSFLPVFHTDLQSVIQKGPMMGRPPQTPQEHQAAAEKQAGILAFVRSILPSSFRFTAPGETTADHPVVVTVPLGSLGGRGDLEVTTSSKDTSWNIGVKNLDEKKAQVTLDSSSKLQVQGPSRNKADLRFDVQLKADVMGFGAEAMPGALPGAGGFKSLGLKKPTGSTLSETVSNVTHQLGDTRWLGDVDATAQVATKLPGQAEYAPWLQELQLERRDLSRSGVVRWQTTSGKQEVPQTRALIDGLQLDVPVLETLLEKIVRVDFGVDVARH